MSGGWYGDCGPWGGHHHRRRFKDRRFFDTDKHFRHRRRFDTDRHYDWYW